MSVWKTLSAINVNDHTEKKNGLTYLSWAWAWGVLKSHYPEATFTKHIQPDGSPCIKDETGYAFVQVTVDVDGISATELFPVLDYRNKAIQNPDAFSVNTAFQRGLAKAISYHGLGHYIYAGEDLPQTDGEARSVEEAPKPKLVPAKPKEALAPPPVSAPDKSLGKMINTFAYKDGDREPRAVSEWDAWSDVSCSWINSARSEDALKKFYTANKVMFTRAKTEATNDYDKVIDCISQTKTKLQKEKK
tara:strand:- start:1378 stop:2118 length:741 start_codon:yes stop_codon:yes gene_type:complete